MQMPLLLTCLTLMTGCSAPPDETAPGNGPANLDSAAPAAVPSSPENPAPEKATMTQQSRAEGQAPLNEAALGYWTLSVDGRAACQMTLNRQVAEGGYGVHVEGCQKSMAIPEAAAWRGQGQTVELLDRQGQVTARLTPSADGGWQGRSTQGQRIALTLAPMM